MIVAIDSNVLLDLLLPDPVHAPASLAALAAAGAAGSLVISHVVLSEVGSQFGSDAELERFLASTGIAAVPPSLAACRDAGARWRSYARGRGGRRRDRIVPDFMIGSHALHHADALLTRDRAFYRAHFPTLRMLG